MKFELVDEKTNYSVVVEYNVDKISLMKFIRLIKKPASGKRVLKGILKRKEWSKIKRLKLPKKSYENVITEISNHEIFPKLDKLAEVSGKFSRKHIQFVKMYARDSARYESLLEEYLD